MISIKKILIAFSFFAIAPVGVFAQEQATTTMKAVVYSDINFEGVRVSTSTKTISGTYAISSRMGQQNDIHTGLVVYKDNIIVDAIPLKTGFSVREGERQTGSFSYTIPNYLSGNIFVLLKAETEEGLPLTVYPVFKETISGTGEETVVCSFNYEKGEMGCASKADTSIEISYGKGGLFSKTVHNETKVLAKNKTLTFVPDLEPGRYVAHIKTGNGESYTVQLSMPGNHGSITNIVVDNKHEGEVYVVVMARTSTSGATIAINLGENCGTASAPFAGHALEFTIKTSCVEGTITAELLSSDGTKLDSETESFSVLPVVLNQGTTTPTNALLYGFGGLLLIGLLMYAYQKFARPASPTTPASGDPTTGPSPLVKGAATAMLFLALSLTGADKAHAYGADLFFYCNPGDAFCPIANAIHVNIFLGDGGPYAPGDTTYIGSYVSSDDNPQYPDNSCGQQACVAPLVRAAYDTTNYGADLYPANLTQSQMRVGRESSYSPFTIPANSTLGTHYVHFSAGSTGYQTVTGSFPVTIQPYCPWYQEFDPGNGTGVTGDGGEIFPGQSIELRNSPLGSPSKYSGFCTGKGGATCPPDPEPYQSTPYTATCIAPGAPTVNVEFSLLERMFKAFAFSN